jgi:hypothetical protein
MTRKRAFRVIRLLALLPLFFVGVQASGTAHAAGECPPVGLDTDCGTLITITNAGGTATATGQPPYDGSEDTLIGVRNLSSMPISSFGLSSPGAVIPPFSFDGDGIDTFGIAGNASDNTGYGGPNAFFTNISVDQDSGTVNFITPIPPGGSGFFSLEGPVTTIAVTIGPTELPCPQGAPTPCYVSANSLSGDAKHGLSFVARYRMYPPIGLRGDLIFQDYTASGTGCAIAIDALGLCLHPFPTAGYCSSYSSSSTMVQYCHLTIDSIICPNSGAGATVKGRWTEPTTQVVHAFRIDVTTGTPSGTWTIQTTKAGGGAYTATIPAQTTIQCT